MAVDAVPYSPVENLASLPKTFYPLNIPVSHWQLRHYISHPDPDVLYYASGRDVYYLNTATRKRKHLCQLPFEARCTASGHGFVCIGGEHDGHFAAVKLEETRQNDVDTAIALDYWYSNKGAPRVANVEIERIGEHIVNSISIHKIHDEDAHLFDVVAALTNNDQTVRIYSLLSKTETTVLHLPDPMNHATISPCGKILAAVGDVNRVYFFTRKMNRDPPQIPKPHNRLNMCSATWEKAGSLSLYIPGGPSTQKGYFTTAWSPRGNLLAVGSEAGYVTLFDMDLFHTVDVEELEDILITTISSSRPNLQAHTCPGAVRSMVFSPDPWDLLIWAEDQGRICVGDLRTILKNKQVIELDPKDSSLDCIVLEDIEGPGENYAEGFMRTSVEELQAHINSLQGQSAEADAVERRWAAPRIDGGGGQTVPDDDPNGLTADEQRILESLRTTRQRQEALAQGMQPRSVNYTSSSMFDDSARGERNSAAYQGQSNVRLPGSREPLSINYPSRQIESLADMTRVNSRWTRVDDHDNTQWTRGNPQIPMDIVRRQGSRTAAHDESSTQAQSGRSTVPTATSPHGARGVVIPPHAIRASDAASNSATDEAPWRLITDAMNLARGPLFESSNERSSATADDTSTNPHVQALMVQRERLRTIQRNLESRRLRYAQTTDSQYGSVRGGATDTSVPGFEVGWELLRQRSGRRVGSGNGLSGFSTSENGVRTAGLAISGDGRTVWAATEEGVFEIKLALKNRSRYPAITLR